MLFVAARPIDTAMTALATISKRSNGHLQRGCHSYCCATFAQIDQLSERQNLCPTAATFAHCL